MTNYGNSKLSKSPPECRKPNILIKNSFLNQDSTLCILLLRYFLLLMFVCTRVCIICSQVLQKPTPEQKQQLAVHSKHVAACVTELVQTAETMKGEATHAAHTRYTRCHTL